MNGQSTELCRALLEIVEKEKDGTPTEVVERQLESRYSRDDIVGCVRQAINEFLLEQIVDYSRREGEVGGDLIWYLRIPSKEEGKRLRSLKPVQVALLKIMYEQDRPGSPGEIKVADAIKKLEKMGFKEAKDENLRIADKIEMFWTAGDEGYIEWFRMIPQHEKTPKRRAAARRAERELEEHIALQTYVTEKLEEEDERRRKKAEPRKKSAKQSSR